MGRRAKGEGSIYRRADGRWCGSIRHDGAEGRSTRTVLYGRTKSEVRDKLKAAIARVDEGAPVRDATATVGTWLKEWRETQLAASNLKPTTRSLYTSCSKNHLEPEPFGKITLDRLRPSDIDRLILDLRKKDLATSTVRQIYHVLRLALAGAVRDKHIARNPCEAVARPTTERKEARYLSAEDVSALLKAAESSRYHALLELIARTGMRRGEAMALKWDDVDLEAGSLRIRGTMARVDGELLVTEPKTAKSRRTLPLSPALIARLKWQQGTQARERRRASNTWHETGFVFTTETGRPVDGRDIYRTIQTAAKKAKLTGVGIHTLRHSAATVMLENGVNIKAVSDLLGHSSIAITGDVYAHVSEKTARDAMETLSDAIGF
jgi:integrase